MRKAASRKKQDVADGDKKPRASAAAAAAAADVDGDGSFDAAVTRANQAPLIVLQTFKLVDALKATGGGHTQRMQTVVDLLEEDAGRPDSLLDLSLVVEGERVSLHSRKWQQQESPHFQLTSGYFLLALFVWRCCGSVVRALSAGTLQGLPLLQE